MENKTDLRIWAKSIRKTLNLPEISNKIADKISNLPQFKQAQNVMLFYPLKSEINLLSLINNNKKFYLPKVEGENLLVCPFKENDTLNISSFGTKEPCRENVSPEILDVIIVPALLADKNNFRLGYGGGFYDRFLAKHKIYSITPAPSELLLDKLPTEKYDIPVDLVITE